MTKEFMLHDGTDEKKTDELHRFLDDIGEDKVLDWEGYSSGIELTLMVTVNVGDTIVYEGDQVIIRRRKQ